MGDEFSFLEELPNETLGEEFRFAIRYRDLVIKEATRVEAKVRKADNLYWEEDGDYLLGVHVVLARTMRRVIQIRDAIHQRCIYRFIDRLSS